MPTGDIPKPIPNRCQTSRDHRRGLTKLSHGKDGDGEGGLTSKGQLRKGIGPGGGRAEPSLGCSARWPGWAWPAAGYPGAGGEGGQQHPARLSAVAVRWPGGAASAPGTQHGDGRGRGWGARGGGRGTMVVAAPRDARGTGAAKPSAGRSANASFGHYI